MMKTWKQKGFIQIPLLAIIVAIVLVTSAGTGVFLYKQNEAKQLTANISESINQSQDTSVDEENQINQEESSKPKEEITQKQPELKQTKSEVEKTNSDLEIARLKTEQEAKNQSESYKQTLRTIISLITEQHKSPRDYSIDMIEVIDQRIDDLKSQISRNNALIDPWSSEELREVVRLFNGLYQTDIDSISAIKEMFVFSRNHHQGEVDKLNHNLNIINSDSLITQAEYMDYLKVVKEFFIGRDPFEYLFLSAENYKKSTEDSNDTYLEALSLLEAYISSHQSTSGHIQSSYYVIPPAQDSFLQNYYQQEQIRALNNISNQLFNIWNELSLPF